MTAGSKVVETFAGVGLLSLLERIGRTAVTDHLRRIHAIGAEPKRPQQPRCRDLCVDLAVFLAVLHLDFVVWCKAHQNFGVLPSGLL